MTRLSALERAWAVFSVHALDLHFGGAPPRPGVDPQNRSIFWFLGSTPTPRVENGEVNLYIDSTDLGDSNARSLVQKYILDRKIHRFEISFVPHFKLFYSFWIFAS